MKYIVIFGAVLSVALYYIIAEVIWQLRNRLFRRRLIIGVLIMALLASQTDFISIFTRTDADKAAAAGTDTESDVEGTEIARAQSEEGRIIIAFIELPDDIREQVVPVGTTLEELVLPDTLEVVCANADTDTKTDTDTTGSQVGGDNVDQDKDDAEEVVPGEGDDAEDVTPDEETEQGEEETPDSPEDDSEEKNQDNAGDDSEEESPSEENGTGTGTPLEEEGSHKQDSTESGSDEVAMQVVTGSFVMPEYRTENVIEVQTLEMEPVSEHTEITEETVTIENITWQSEPEYDAFMPGEYVFTAVLPDGYALTDTVNIPRITVQVYAGDAPLTAEQEAEMLAGLQNNPVPLTEADILADSPELAAQAANRIATVAALEKHPGTYIVTDDNENNAGTGEADGDLDKYLCYTDKQHPIEANVFIDSDKLPTQSCYVAVRTYDVDWQDGEYDKLFVNDVQIGVLTGLNGQWNTSYYQVPLSCLKKGKNTIRVEIWDCSDTSKVGDNNPPIKQTNRWSVSVDWMQLVCDGGSKEGVEEYFLALTDARTSGSNVSFQAETVIKTSSGGTFDTEYSIVNNKGFIYGSYQGAGVSGNESFTITMPKNSPDGTYTLQGMLKRRSDGAILATDSMDFRLQNGEAILGPKLTHTLTPDILTNQDVTIDVVVESAGDFTDINIAGSNKTVQTNGRYDFTYTYRDAKGTSYSNTYKVEVDNIDKEPPVITYAPAAVWPDMSGTEVEEQVRSALTVTDNVTGDCQVTVSGIPTNPAQYEGEQMSVSVTAADEAGNTATKQCAVNVLAMPFVLATPTAVRSGTTTSFTLSSKITALGGETVTETGFVWGIMQRPTLELNNGTGKTSSAVTAKDVEIKVTATDIVDGVTYYMRAYAKTKGGTVYYSEQATFGIDAKKFGTFSIKYTSASGSKSTFTISRTGGTDGVQTVYYRTVNGSAIGGTHFTHAAGSVTFNDGDQSKTVQVTESGVTAAYNSKTTTKYSNADRTYQVEIYRVEGGGALADSEDSRFATRTMTKDSNYTIARSVYSDTAATKVSMTSGTNGERVTDDFTNSEDNRTRVNYYKGTEKNGTVIINYYDASNLSTFFSNGGTYLQNTAQSWLYRYDLSTYKYDDSYQDMIIRAATSRLGDKMYDKSSQGAAPGAGGSSYSISGLKWSACIDNLPKNAQRDNIQFPCTTAAEGGISGISVNFYGTENCVSSGGNQWIQFGITETAYAEFGANGLDEDDFYVNYFAPHALVQDTVEPQLLGIAPMAGGTYKPGDKVTISLVFDEIVDSRNSSLNSLSSIETSWGIMTYAGGADTNVLYFTGTVPNSAGTTLSLTSLNCASSIKDMCDTSSTKAASGSGSTSASVNTTTPTVTLNNRAFANGTASMKVTATNCNTLQYVWTNSTTLPVNGWMNCKSGDTLSTRQTSGKWYLHVLGTYSATGASVHEVSAVFDFGTPESPTAGAAAPELTVTANSTNWAQSRTINIVKTPSTGTVKLIKTPSGEVNENVSGNTYTAKTNGAYTFTMTADGETVTGSVQVSKIDVDAPELTLREPGNAGAVYNKLVFGIDATDKLSGVAKVEYVIDNSASAPSTGWKTAAAGSDGSYSATYTATNIDKSTYYVHVRATDNAGNISAVKTSSTGYTLIKAADTADKPAITLSGAPTAWQNEDADLTWTLTGVGAGECRLMEEGAEEAKNVTKDDTGTITAERNGVYYISVMDSNGEIGEAKAVVNFIDKDAPVISNLSVTEGWAQSQTITAGGITDNVTVQFTAVGLSAANSGSGVAKMEYREAGSTGWEEYTGNLIGQDISFTAEKNGEYSIRLTDKVGNVNTYTMDVWGIDVTAPVVDCKVSTDGKVNGWYASAPEITITYKDNAGAEGPASGIANAKYAIVTDKTKPVDSALQEFPAGGKVSLTQDGTYYLYYQVSDNAGNVTDSYTELIKIDMTEPAFDVSGQDEGQDVETGLTFDVSAGDFGISGGYIIAAKSGTAESAAQRIIEVGEAAGGTAGRQTGTYQIKEPGTYYFRMYTNAGKSREITLNVYKVTFDTKNGTAIPAQLVWTDQTASAGQGMECRIVKPEDPEREGYTFSDWYADAVYTQEFDFNAQVKANTTVYAGWNGKQYTVTFDYQGATGGNEEETKTVIYGSSYEELPVPTRDGYNFKGWYTKANGGSVVGSDTAVSIADDHTLYAQWTNKSSSGGDNNESTGGDSSKKDGDDNTGDDGGIADEDTNVTIPTDQSDTDPQTSDEDTGAEKPTSSRAKELTDPEPEGTGKNTESSDETQITDRTARAELQDSGNIITGDIIATGSISTAENSVTTITVGAGAVIVTVDSDGYRSAAGVADTVAVANAVLTPEQKQRVNDGERIEIRVVVTDSSEQVSKEDKDIIESGLADNKIADDTNGREPGELILGAYIDISMYIKVGDGDWETVVQTGEPIDVVLGIPDELRLEGRTYYVARSHEGVFDLLNDLDNKPDTITIRTELFSAYAILHTQTGIMGGNTTSRCSLCHICPTFLGICCFIWMTVIILVIVTMIFLLFWKRRKDEEAS